MKPKKLLILLLLFIPASLFTCSFHEFGHWLIGEITGNEMTFGLNHVSVKEGHYLASDHEWLITLSGPLFTLIQAIILWVFIEIVHFLYLFPFLFFSFFIRFAVLFSGNLTMQDEAIIARGLGLSTQTIIFPLLILLLFMVYRSHQILKFKWYHQLLFSVISLICLFGIILTDEFIL
ncbi:MAG: hypothetical protein R6U66_01900 [Bacteroidales bacterium]